MNRYLGTKTKILPELHKELFSCTKKPDPIICDVFSGSLAVSLSLKRLGAHVIANDINDLSYVYGKAYLLHSVVPQLKVESLLKAVGAKVDSELKDTAYSLIETERTNFDKNNTYGEFKSWNDYSSRLYSIALILAYFQGSSVSTKGNGELKRCDILERYTKWGKNSEYLSSRNTRGRRNYFTKENAHILDRSLNHIRFWYRQGMISEFHRCVLISILLDSMERYVNSQGTYHDFLRNEFEPRAKKKFRFSMPNYFGLLHAKRKHYLGKSEDSLNFISKVHQHDVLYIDPPYNFRQYTAYYFLPNFMAKHALIHNLDDYMSKIKYVRGQNMDDDFTSPFSNRDKFIPALNNLVRAAKCKYVVMSYFDGVNHWNKFLQDDNSVGIRILKKFFGDTMLFDQKSIKLIPVDRMNYQSQDGHKGKIVKEYIIVAKKKNGN